MGVLIPAEKLSVALGEHAQALQQLSVAVNLATCEMRRGARKELMIQIRDVLRLSAERMDQISILLEGAAIVQ